MEITDAALLERGEPAVRAVDFLVITWSNKLLFASFAGCFHGLKRIVRMRDDGIRDNITFATCAGRRAVERTWRKRDRSRLKAEPSVDEF